MVSHQTRRPANPSRSQPQASSSQQPPNSQPQGSRDVDLGRTTSYAQGQLENPDIIKNWKTQSTIRSRLPIFNLEKPRSTALQKVDNAVEQYEKSANLPDQLQITNLNEILTTISNWEQSGKHSERNEKVEELKTATMQYRRAKTKGATYFFTVVTHRGRKILCEPDNVVRTYALYTLTIMCTKGLLT